MRRISTLLQGKKMPINSAFLLVGRAYVPAIAARGRAAQR